MLALEVETRVGHKFANPWYFKGPNKSWDRIVTEVLKGRQKMLHGDVQGLLCCQIIKK